MPTEKRQRQKQGQQARRAAAQAQMRRRQRRRRLQVFAVLSVVVIAAIALLSQIGGNDGPSTSAATTTTLKTPPTSAKPADPGPGGTEPVTALKIEDLKVGSGREVKKGDTVVANYVGARYADGKVFGSTWGSGRTFEAVIQEPDVIPGWAAGVPGMKVGGRRKLTIPAAMAYGNEDRGDGAPYGDLVFIIDVYAVK